MLDSVFFNNLFDSMYLRLVSYSLQFVKSKTIAEEVVADCFVKLWEKREELGHVDNIKSYLYTMVRNTSFTYLNNNKKEVQLNQDLHDQVVRVDNEIIMAEVHATLYKALDALPAGCRTVFELSCLKGLKYKDIASDLNVSINTVKSQRARAIKLLRDHLKDNPLLIFILYNL